jgi:hypothetical protein
VSTLHGARFLPQEIFEMNKSGGMSAPFAVLLGVFLLIEGIWGMTSPVVFGVFTTNWLHASIHIILGILGVFTGVKGGSRGYCSFVGGLLALVGILYFVPVVGAIITSLLAVNSTVAIFNLIVGIVAILIARASRPDIVVVQAP